MNYFFGFSYWKHEYIKPFFDFKPIFINPFFLKNHLKKALKKGLNKNSTIYIWGKKEFMDVEEYAKKNGIHIYRVEDGFIRSVGLGSDLTQPYSIIVDKRGIYFDPTNESDLEYILSNHIFSELEIKRAKKIKDIITNRQISKYNIYNQKEIAVPDDKKIILAVGQVEDDASIKFGGEGMTNLELLKEIRKNEPNAYIIYKPHPDVLSGNRKGLVHEQQAQSLCDIVIKEVSIDSVFAIADEVHTITSLVGFEALLRGKMVVTYGMPFYAGWGLTKDKKICKRRQRKVSLEELVAATYILYPKYIHPILNKQCQIEDLLEAIEQEKERYNTDKFYRAIINIKNKFLRKIQLLARILKGE